VLALTLAIPAAARPEPPRLTLASVTVKRTAPKGGYAGSVSVRVRWCASVGPGAALVVQESRRVGSVTKARDRWTDPLGVDLDRVQPYDCVSGYLLSWAVKSRLFAGPGVYGVAIRVRDGLGKLSAPLSLSLRPGR
jgi:hypothetical protein